MTRKKNIKGVLGLLKSKTSVTKQLLKERAKDKKKEEVKFERNAARYQNPSVSSKIYKQGEKKTKEINASDEVLSRLENLKRPS